MMCGPDPCLGQSHHSHCQKQYCENTAIKKLIIATLHITIVYVYMILYVNMQLYIPINLGIHINQ